MRVVDACSLLRECIIQTFRVPHKILVPMHHLHLDIDRLFLGIDPTVPNYDPVLATNSACAANHIVRLSRVFDPCMRRTHA